MLAFHLVTAATSVNDQGKEEQMIKQVKSSIILTDSTGKKDTMLLEEYLKQRK